MEEKIEKLRLRLEGLSIDHEREILKQENIKSAHVYCVINNIPSQKYGLFLENYIRKQYKYKKNNPSQCIGDCSNGKENIEIKVSLGGKKFNKFNYVQIRLSHKISTYILTAYYLCIKNVSQEGELYIFSLSAEEMKKIILLYGGYAHGTW